MARSATAARGQRDGSGTAAAGPPCGGQQGDSYNTLLEPSSVTLLGKKTSRAQNTKLRMPRLSTKAREPHADAWVQCVDTTTSMVAELIAVGPELSPETPLTGSGQKNGAERTQN